MLFSIWQRTGLRLVLFLFASLSTGELLPAHDVITTKVTFSREVARIFYQHCTSCHHNGGTAFSLVSYAEARTWAKAIKEEVLERRMPPWDAVKGFGSFQNDAGLTQEDLEVISDWVEGGAPEGDPALLPKSMDLTTNLETRLSSAAKLVLQGATTTHQALTLVGIQPRSVPEGSSLKVIAERPDGSIEPLLWLYKFNPKYERPYYYRNPISLPAGTRLEEEPANGGGVALLTR